MAVDRDRLKKVAGKIKDLAHDLKLLHDEGFMVNFGINNATGESTISVKQMVDVKIDLDS